MPGVIPLRFIAGPLAIIMRVLRYIGFALIGLMIFNLGVIGQDKAVRLDFGFGQSESEGIRPVFVSPFQNYDSKSIQIGLGYDYSPEGAIFRLKSGLTYNYRGYLDDLDLSYLRIPICFDFIFGKRIQPYFGAGLFGSYLIGYDSGDSDFSDNKKRFQFGLIFNAGVEFVLSDMLSIDIGYLVNSDLTKMYFYTIPTLSHPDVSREIGVYGTDKILRVGVKYKL